VSRFPSPPEPDPSREEVPAPPVEVTHHADRGVAEPMEENGGFPGWLGGIVAILVIGGGAAGYWVLRDAAPETAPAETPLVAAAPSAPRTDSLPRAGSADAVPSLATSAAERSSVAENQEPKAAPAPTAELLTKVRALAIAAVIPGPRGRAMIDGRMRDIGDEVLPGLVLSEVNDGQLVFTDEAGALYPRRF